MAEYFVAIRASGFAGLLGFQDAQGVGKFLFALFPVVGLEELLLGHDAIQAQEQLVRGKRLDDVVVRHQFDRRHHLLVGLFAGHHHENGFVGEQVEAAQFFQKLLSRAPFAQHVVAQDDVRRVVADAVDGVLVIGGKFDRKGTDGLGHGTQCVAGLWLVVNDQKAFLRVDAHYGRRNSKRAPPRLAALLRCSLPSLDCRVCRAARRWATIRPVP